MRFLAPLLMLLVACSADDGESQSGTADIPQPGFEPPVITNPESPVSYPPALYEDGVEGTVILHLFVNEDGEIIPDSSRIAEGSGHVELDSAALAGVATMRFAPARRNGVPVAITFLQPVHFRLPEGSEGGA